MVAGTFRRQASWWPVITATDVDVRAGSQLLLSKASFRVGPGQKIGLVGRNGAGKTTLTRILAMTIGARR